MLLFDFKNGVENFSSHNRCAPPPPHKSNLRVHERGGRGNAKYRIACWGDVRLILVTQDRYSSREVLTNCSKN
jgi:hypothetical protein